MKYLFSILITVAVSYGCSHNCEEQKTGYIKFVNPTQNTFDCIIMGDVKARIGPNTSLVIDKIPHGEITIGFQKVGMEVNIMPAHNLSYNVSTCDTVIAHTLSPSSIFSKIPSNAIAAENESPQRRFGIVE